MRRHGRVRGPGPPPSILPRLWTVSGRRSSNRTPVHQVRCVSAPRAPLPRPPHGRQRGRGPSRHLLDLEQRLVDEEVEPADDGSAAGRPGGGEGRRPGVVQHVEEDARPLRYAGGEGVGGARRGGGDGERCVEGPRAVGPVGHPDVHAEPLPPAAHLVAALLAAYVGGDGSGADHRERGEGGGGGGSGAQDRGGLDLLDAALAQGGDHAGDVRVVTDPASVPGEHDRVDGLHGGGRRADLVQQRDDRPLERHGQGQPRPGGVQRLDEAGQRRLVDLEPVVGPVVEAEFGVGGAVQHRGERVGDGRAEDGGPAADISQVPAAPSTCCSASRARRWSS